MISYFFAIKLCLQMSFFIALFNAFTFGEHHIGQPMLMLVTDIIFLLASSYFLLCLILNIRKLYQFITQK